MRKLNYFLILLLFLSTTLFAKANTTNYTEDKTAIFVTSDNPQFTIQLISNPTTGYSWFVRDYNTNLIEPIKHEFVPPKDKKLMGAPGSEIWTFKVKKAGFFIPQQTVIQLVYARPWESADPAKQLTFRVSTTSVLSEYHSQKSAY